MFFHPLQEEIGNLSDEEISKRINQIIEGKQIELKEDRKTSSLPVQNCRINLTLLEIGKSLILLLKFFSRGSSTLCNVYVCSCWSVSAQRLGSIANDSISA